VAERLFIVRHGQTEWSANGRHTGFTDIPLTDKGRLQAEKLVGELGREDFALVLSSPLQRAWDTCELAGFGEVAERDDDLREWNYGDYEGLTTPQIREHNPDWNMWQDGCPGGETPPEIGARVDRVLARVAGAHGDVLAFAHGHLLRVVTARWLEMEVAAGSRFKLDPAGVGVLGYERATAAMDRWNAVPPD
jgi:probable phosphoglycerate mutase